MIVTFFPIEQAGPGPAGIGETSETAFRVAKASLGYWTKRFAEEQIAYEPIVQVFGESVLRFKDPDGMSLLLVGIEGGGAGLVGRRCPGGTRDPWLHGVTLLLKETGPTAAALTFEEAGREGSAVRFTGGAALGSVCAKLSNLSTERNQLADRDDHLTAARSATDRSAA